MLPLHHGPALKFSHDLLDRSRSHVISLVMTFRWGKCETFGRRWLSAKPWAYTSVGEVMHRKPGRFGLLCLYAVFFIVPLARSQGDTKMDAKSRAEVERLRSIATAIKACPRVAEWKNTGIGTIYDGPPSNVVWDVKPSDSIRAPYFGYVEFFLPSRLRKNTGTG